jgi:glucose-1-phosphate thymidylyltransferase
VFLGNDSRALTLRDNIDDGRDLATPPAHASERPEGASVFERYGVVKFDKSFWTLLIEQKPQTPRSNYAVAGLYLYDSQVVDIAAGLPPSARGELEIGDVSSHYLVSGNLNVEIMGRAYAWLDTRTHDSLIEAPTFVATCRKRQGLLVACPEEIASRKEWISPEQMERLAAPLAKNDYGKYLLKLLRDAVA